MKESMDATAMEGAAYNKSNSSDQFGPPAGVLVKGKRTKRQRTVVVGPTSSSASSTEVTGSSTTEEEEDMAHCLILLAQGRALDLGREDHLKAVAAEEEAGAGEKPTGRKAGDYVYECKTCSKCFPSFQALGGHRTSHKKPKMAILAETKRPVAEQDVGPQIAANSSIPKPIAPTPSKPRMHECMICGSEFSSGQALGGHMRRHRPLTPAEPSEVKKDKAVFVLDLNLPAPTDGDLEELPMSPAAAAAAAMAFPFESQQSLVF